MIVYRKRITTKQSYKKAPAISILIYTKWTKSSLESIFICSRFLNAYNYLAKWYFEKCQTDYTVVERSRKGTGFDYWLARKDDVLFQKSARLEVSGIRNGDIDAIKARVKTKLNQVRRSDDLGLLAFIVVVEFSNPLSQVVQR